MIVNGVTLPDIPDKVLELSQYYIIHRMYSDTSEIYSIRVLPNAAVYFPPGMITEYGTLYSPEYYTFNLSTDGNEWIDAGSGVGELAISIGVVDGVTDELLFSNHDIYEVTSVNAETGEFTTGEIYFPNSEAEEEPEETKPPRYSIATAILVGTARQIMRLTGSSAKVKPEEFEPKLEGINIQLQELTVTATEEVQTITPPSGVYGFSKVIVEAVEDSGSAGGGGTGEGGDDSGDSDIDIAPDVSSGAFGDVYTEGEEVYTGKFIYGGLVLPAVPAAWADKYPYHYIYRGSDGAIYLLMSESPLYYDPQRKLIWCPGAQMAHYMYVEMNDEWSPAVGTNVAIKPTTSTMLWAGHGVANGKDGEEDYYSGTVAVPERNKSVTSTPSEVQGSYTVSGSDLNTLGSLAQKLSGSTDPMTFSEIVETLEKAYG